MTILVTGAGLIGRLTAAQLLARGEPVLLTDVRRPDSAELGALPLALCDVTDYDALSRLVDEHGVTAIVHTAALLSTAIRKDPLAGIRVNTMGTANVLELARQRKLSRVVIASSTTVMYSAFPSLPATPIAEDFPLRVLSERPGSIYAATKLAGEHLALAYASLYDVDAVVLRYGAVLGAGRDAVTSVPGRLLATLLEAGRTGVPARLDDPILLWNGREEFIDARDCAIANIAALTAPAPRQRVYNIATGEWFSVEAFIDVVRQCYPALQTTDLRLPEGGFAGFPHVRPASSDVSAAHREIGFKASYSLLETTRHFAAML